MAQNPRNIRTRRPLEYTLWVSAASAPVADIRSIVIALQISVIVLFVFMAVLPLFIYVVCGPSGPYLVNAFSLPMPHRSSGSTTMLSPCRREGSRPAPTGTLLPGRRSLRRGWAGGL